MKNKKLIVINIFGAPSAGKSATMLGLTYYMKLKRFSVEQTPEFAKELAIEKRYNMFGKQLYILGEQSKRLEVLKGQYDFAVTDCPLQLISYYTPDDYIKSFQPMVDELFDTYENVNYFLERKHAFENEGRVHDDKQSIIIEKELKSFLDEKNIKYTILETCENIPENVVRYILNDILKLYPDFVGNNIAK